MSYALIEVEAMAKKAARGAGFSWGMAEEAAKATRWLCAAGVDGVAALARALERADGVDQAGTRPQRLGGDWRARSGEMCPIMAGAALSDSAVFWRDGGKRIETVVVPVMLVPFAAAAARQLGAPVTLEWDKGRAVTDGSVLSLATEDEGAGLETAGSVTVRAGGTLGTPLPPQTRASPADADWQFLNRLAHRTYAPDTEDSRLKGAGAGLTDND